MEKILLVEDDRDIAELERDYLELNGFAVDMEANGRKGLARALAEDYDLLILDVMLPELDGLAICKAVREQKEIPILMVTARKEDIDKIRGLSVGADDYIVKPFSPNELVARVRAHLTRYQRLMAAAAAMVPKAELIHGSLRLLPDERRVFLAGQEVHLPNREFELLEFFLTHPAQVFSKEEIFEALWGAEAVGDISTVAVHVKRLREKIETAQECHIETVWGTGYRLNHLGE
ncbi:response regulator transcription factor [Selenomonas ruminantium]|uniref:response regulator transcription factor n=1 Tax=Selenomonas ruminantium TaxID=971 RepID=UPI0026F0C33D|nr:response regulator transcription factor [Selenomonas ruminantium]